MKSLVEILYESSLKESRFTPTPLSIDEVEEILDSVHLTDKERDEFMKNIKANNVVICYTFEKVTVNDTPDNNIKTIESKIGLKTLKSGKYSGYGLNYWADWYDSRNGVNTIVLFIEHTRNKWIRAFVISSVEKEVVKLESELKKNGFEDTNVDPYRSFVR